LAKKNKEKEEKIEKRRGKGAERVPKSKPMASPSTMTGKVPVMPNDPD
jgi:hypothetical protein